MEALREVSLRFADGDRVALVGPNGSGKSTLLRALLGLIGCEGTMLLDGRPPFEDRIALMLRTAYVPQIAPQLGASVREWLDLIRLTRGLPQNSIIDEAARLNLQLAEILGRPFRHLSGGMKQKLLLAIAFAVRPSLLVLDEPTASLDEATRKSFFKLCQELPKETTMLLCSHRLEEIDSLTTHVVALAEGRVVYDGTREGYRA